MKILLIVYDNDSKINTFPMGIAYISAALKKADHEVEIYNQDIYHWPEEHLTNHLNANDFDVVGIGMCGGYYQYQKLIKISNAIHKARNPPYYVIGGPIANADPKYFLDVTGAARIIIGEGEETIVELLKNMNDIPLGSAGYRYVSKNGAFIKEFYQAPRRPQLDIDSISWPDYDAFQIDHYCLASEPGFNRTDRMLPMLSARGCPFKCNFCSKQSYLGYKVRSTESIIEEIKFLKQKYYINSIEFQDELLMGSVDRAKELCEAFIRENLNIKWWCNGRLNYAKKDLLTLMSLAGCKFINYGIEAIDNNVLKRMNKNLTVEQIIPGVENTIRAGIIPGLNIIFGNYGDNLKVLKKDVAFLKKYGDGNQLRTVRYVTGYPGTQLFEDSVKAGKIKDVQDFYENKHKNSDLLTVNFTEMSEKEMYKAMKWANDELIKDYYQKNLNKTLDQCEQVYENKDLTFRGFRSV